MPERLEQLYDAHAEALFRHVLVFTRREELARDILQDVFVKLARQPPDWRVVRDPRAYLLTMAHRQAIDAHRRAAVRHAHRADWDEQVCEMFAPADDPDIAEFRERLAEALGHLPQEQRAVVQLKLWEELTFAEIAVVLGIPANTAASRFRYGIDKLRALLRPIYEEIQ